MTDLDVLVKQGKELYPVILEGNVSDPDVTQWARAVQRERKFLGPLQEGFFKAGVYTPLKAYYRQHVEIVAERASFQYRNGEEFDVSEALQELDMRGRDTVTLGALARKVYSGPEEEIKQQEEYLEMIAEVRPKTRAKALFYGIAGSCFLAFSTNSFFAGLSMGVAYLILMSIADSKLTNFWPTAIEEDIPYRNKGDACNIPLLKRAALEELMSVSR